MKHIIISLKDKKIGFTQIWLSPNEGFAIRGFGEQCKTQDTQMYKYPEDYELWTVGEFDDEKGITSTEQKKIAEATQYKGE